MRFRPGLVPTLFVALSLPVLLSLGLWQLERTHWKDDLIGRIETRLALDPIPATRPADIPREEFRRVRLTGRFAPQPPMWLGGRTDAGRAGWHLVAPFLLEEGGWVVVDRGWVPMAARRDGVPGTGPDTPEVQDLEGVVRLPPPAGTFTPDNDPAANTWYRIDPPAMAAARDLSAAEGLLDVYVAAAGVAAPDGPLPVGDRFVLPQNHFQYALTWFGLAATLAAVYLAYGLRRRSPITAPGTGPGSRPGTGRDDEMERR
ncbi:MAG: SURF1 family protein [Alphaproteobacteria bacterium]